MHPLHFHVFGTRCTTEIFNEGLLWIFFPIFTMLIPSQKDSPLHPNHQSYFLLLLENPSVLSLSACQFHTSLPICWTPLGKPQGLLGQFVCPVSPQERGKAANCLSRAAGAAGGWQVVLCLYMLRLGVSRLIFTSQAYWKPWALYIWQIQEQGRIISSVYYITVTVTEAKTLFADQPLRLITLWSRSNWKGDCWGCDDTAQRSAGTGRLF